MIDSTRSAGLYQRFPKREGNCSILHQSWLRNPNANQLLWREMVSVLSAFVNINVNCLDTLGEG